MSPEEIEQEARSIDFGQALILLSEARARNANVTLTRSEAGAVLHALESMAAYVAAHKEGLV